MDRPMPNNINLEMSLIGSLLEFREDEYDRLYEIALDVKPDMFFLEVNRDIVRFLLGKILEDRMVPDPLVLSSKFPQVDISNYLSVAELEFKLSDLIIELKKLAVKRAMIVSAYRLITIGQGEQCDSIPEMLGAVNKEAESIVNAHSVVKRVSTRETLQNACQRIQEANTDEEMYRVRYHHPEIDDAVTIYRQQIHTLGAFQGHGKTAMAIDAMRYQVLAGMRVAYFCTESPSDEIMLRLMGNDMEISVETMMGSMKESQSNVTRFARTAETLRQLSDNFYIYGCDDFPLYIDDIASICSKISRENGQLDMVYLDYLQDLDGPRHKKNLDERQQIGYNAKGFKRICVDLNCAGTMLSQFNQETHKDKKPSKRSFRGSGVISDVSHLMSCLWRQKENMKNSMNPTWWYSVKTRIVSPWSCNLEFNGPSGRFSRGHRYGPEDDPGPERKAYRE